MLDIFMDYQALVKTNVSIFSTFSSFIFHQLCRHINPTNIKEGSALPIPQQKQTPTLKIVHRH